MPVVARRDPTTLLDPVEEPFAPVAGAVKTGAEADRIVAIAFRRDVGPCACLDGKLPVENDPNRPMRLVQKLDYLADPRDAKILA